MFLAALFRTFLLPGTLSLPRGLYNVCKLYRRWLRSQDRLRCECKMINNMYMYPPTIVSRKWKSPQSAVRAGERAPMQQRAALIQRRLVVAAGAGATAWYAGRQLDRQRRPLQGCHAANLQTALPTLQTSGVCVINGIVDQGLVSAIKGTSLYRSMPTSNAPQGQNARKERFETRRNGEAPAKEWRLSSSGRYHQREETWGEGDLKVIEHVERLIWPLVTAFFQDDATSVASTQPGIFRSELQLLNAVPGSANQTWHSDNQARGLSIIVPLVDFTAENGATQVIVGSHNGSWPLVVEHGAQVVQAPVGSIAAYDSRTYHRGLGNQTMEGRPALIFCYDRPSSPPPGCGTCGMLVNANLAGLLNLVSAALITCAW